MGRPAKNLRAHVQEGTFRARRATHRALLLGAPLEWPVLASLQRRYAQAQSAPELRALALEFERIVATAQSEAKRRTSTTSELLAAELATLGKPGSLPQLLRFFPYFFAHPRGPMIGQPFRLEPWQQRFLREFFRRDQQGRRLYRNGLLSIPRGNGKTPLAAGLGLYELLTRHDAPEVYFAAGSKEQAAIGLGFARDFVEQGPLSDWIRAGSKLSCPTSGGWMQVISADGRLHHGRAPSAAIFDELWAVETNRERQTYTSLASALHKRPDAYLLALTTAGYDKTSLLGEIYTAALDWPELTVSKNGCLTIAKDQANGQLLYWYGAPEQADIDDTKTWRACNPASWINLRELKRQLNDPGLGEHEFRRLNLNQWTSSKNAWLPHGCWNNLHSDEHIPDDAPIYIGVDVGLHHDTTAVSWAHQTSDGRILLRAHVWAANDQAQAHDHNSGGTVDLEQIEQFIRDLARRYRLREVAYDPRFFERSAQLLEKEGLTMVEFLQASAPMGDAYQRFYQLALEGKLAHNSDPIFATHINATAARKTERGWKISKLKSTQHIDATVAAVLATARANLARDSRPPQIFWLDA